MTKKRSASKRLAKQRKPPVHIPLPFDTAVSGLLGVKPRTKKKPATKKATGRKK